MRDLKKLAMPKNKRKCLTVSGAGHSTTVAILDSVGAQPLAHVLNPKNVIRLREDQNAVCIDAAEPWNDVFPQYVCHQTLETA